MFSYKTHSNTRGSQCKLCAALNQLCSCPGWPRKGQLFLGPLAPQNDFVTLVLQNDFKKMISPKMILITKDFVKSFICCS